MDLLVSLAVRFTFGKEGKLQENKQKGTKTEAKGTVQERKHFCRTLTRLSGCGAGPGRISVACGNYPAWACKDRCMRKPRAVQRKSAFRKGVPSISLQVLFASGRVKSRKFAEKLRKT